MKSEKGQAALEFALVLPILLLLVCGIVDFGRILYTKNTLTSMSEQAARYASLDYTNTDAEIDTYVRTNAGVSDTSAGTLTVAVAPTPTRVSGNTVKITLTYKIYYITPFMNKILASPFIIKSYSTFRVE